jgi:DivIVA domain-containing protein
VLAGMEDDQDATGLASWLRGVREQLTAATGLSMRYLARDVDAFFSSLAADLDSGALPDPGYLRNVRFPVSRLGPGYPLRDVEELIRGLERRLGEAADTAVPEGSDTDPLIARITNAQFRTTRRGQGYDQREVDDFLEDVIQALRRGEEASPPTGFTTTRLRPGYDKQDVDALMREMWPEWGAR